MAKILRELEIIKKMITTNDLINVDEAAKFLRVKKELYKITPLQTENQPAPTS